MNSEEGCRLYLITPPRLDPAAFLPVLDSCLDAGDVACLQLRLKGAPDDEIRRAAEILMPAAQSRGVAFLINDRPDLAAELGADGAHIGAEDMPVQDARKRLGADAILGASAYNSRHLAMEAAEQGADYVAFGAFFPTTTKQPPAQAEIDLLEWWSDLMTVPSVAIGGITVANCEPLVRAGADFLAVISGIWDHAQGPAAAVRGFNEVFERNR